MSRLRVWVFTAVVGLALAANLVLLSPHVVQAAEDGLGARLRSASAGLRGQLDLLDARLAPRGLAQNAELLDTLRAPDPSVPAGRPDERALRAAASVLSPEPDLLVVANGAGAVVSRRGKAAAMLDDLGALGPLREIVDAASGKAVFVDVDKQLYRVVAARAPGGAGVVVTGALVDDRFAQQQKALFDAEVAFFDAGRLAASSVPPGPRRDDLARWQAARGATAGFGKLLVRLPLVGHRFDGALPAGTSGLATRAALVPLDGSVQAALAVPAGPALAWFARYQVLYAVGLALLFVLGLLWSLPQGAKAAAQPAHDRAKPAPDRSAPPLEREPEVGPVRRRPRSLERGDAGASSVASLLGADVSPPEEPGPGKLSAGEVPWSPSLEGKSHWSSPPGSEGPEPTNGAGREALEHGSAAPEAEAGHELHKISRESTAARPGDRSQDPAWASIAPDDSPPAGAAPPEPLSPAGRSSGPNVAFSAGADALDPELDPQLETLPATPREDLLARARDDGARDARDEDAVPGNQPTRVQPISAALLEKLRERDEAAVPSSYEGSPSRVSAGAAEPAPASEASANEGAAGDPDELHFKETFDQFLALREQTGEGRSTVTYEKFAARLRKNREELLARHGARGVRFAVYVKDGKAAIKASTTR